MPRKPKNYGAYQAHLIKMGRRIRRFRERAKLTQEQLALQAEMSTSHVVELEAGIRDPHVTTLIRLSQVFGLSPAFLLLDFKALVEVQNLMTELSNQNVGQQKYPKLRSLWQPLLLSDADGVEQQDDPELEP